MSDLSFKWISVKDMPDHDKKVLMLGFNKSYQFGHPQLLAGHFVKKYYDVILDDFRVTSEQAGFWTITHYMPINFLPEPPTNET